jgi:hypothetical protein
MLDRSQHLKMFLTSSGCGRDNANLILSNARVWFVLNQQPVDALGLLEAVDRASQFTLNREQESEFLAVFGRYRSAACVGARAGRFFQWSH